MNEALASPVVAVEYWFIATFALIVAIRSVGDI